MATAAPLSRLLALSTQVVEAVVVGPDGVESASVADGERARALADAGAALLETAAGVRPGLEVGVDRVSVETESAALVVVRDGDRSIVATTVPEPTLGLVVYDLRSALRDAGTPDEEQPAPRAKKRKKGDA